MLNEPFYEMMVKCIIIGDKILIWSCYYIKCTILGNDTILDSKFGDLSTKLSKSNNKINIYFYI